MERLAACGVDTYRVGRTCYSCAAVSGSAGVALFFVLVPFVLALFIWLVTHDPRRGQAPLAISMRFLESLALLQYVDIRWPGRGQWLFHIAGLTNLDGFVFPLSCVLRPLSTAELLAVPLVINGAFLLVTVVRYLRGRCRASAPKSEKLHGGFDGVDGASPMCAPPESLASSNVQTSLDEKLDELEFRQGARPQEIARGIVGVHGA